MDKQNQIGLDSLNNSGSGLTEVPWGAQQGEGAELKEVPFFQPTAPKPATTTATPQTGATPARSGGAIASDKLDAIAQREGLTPEQTRIWKNGILAQESGQGANSKTSVDGARGAGQIIPGTFAGYAKPGERIDNEEHNLAVSARIVKDLAKKFGDDPAKIAVGYFSGEGNVNTGKGNPYKANKADGNGKHTADYATDIVRRLTGASNAQAAEADTAKIPKWSDITAKPEFAKLSPEDRQAAKEAYFDYYIAPITGAESAALRTEFLANKDAAPAAVGKNTVKNPFVENPGTATASSVPTPSLDSVASIAGQTQDVEAVDVSGQNKGAALNAPPATGPSTAPSAVVQSQGGSVMNTDTPLQGKPSSAFSPVRPEVRAALEGSWDAAPAKERKRLEALPGWQGDIFRARAEGFRRQDNMGRDPLQSVQMRQQLEAAYDAASPEERQRLEALPGWQGEVFRQKRDGVFSIGKNQSPEFAQSGPTVQSADRRREAREAQLIGKGEKPEFAAAAAAAGAKRGATPGNEVGALEGVAQNSDFDFDTAKLFDPNERPNGLNNPLVRGVIKSGGDLYKFSTGLSEFAFDLVGADDMAKGMRSQADWIRAKENAMGEGGALKHVEGAIRSIASQMPFIASGSEPLALGGMALTVFGQEYSDGRAKGQTVGEASMRAGLYAIAELIGEKFSIGANMKAARALFDGAPVDQVAKLIGQILIKEVPGEALTSALEFGADKLPGGVGLNTEAGWAEFAQQQAETFVQTVIQSGLMGGAPLARAHLSDKGGITERRLSEMRAMAAQDQALAKWEQFRQSIRPSEPSVGNPTQAPTSSRNEPTVGAATPSTSTVSADGRVEPTLDESQPSVAPGDKQAEDDLTDLAEVRRNQLQGKRDGTTAMVMTENGPQEVDQPAMALTPAERRELDILEGGDWNAIRSFYFGNKPQEGNDESVQTQSENGGTAPGRAEEAPVGANGQPGGTTAVQKPATEAAGAQGSTESGQRQPGNAAEGSVSIPYDTVEFAGEGQPLRRSNGEAGMIDYSGRKIVMRNVNGVMVPFYLSTGSGGKADVPSGKWYPFFGIGQDGWINKTGGKEMANYYGSQALRQAAEELDRTVGDIRNDDSIPKVGRTGRHIDFINQNFDAASNGEADTLNKVRGNITRTLMAVDRAPQETEAQREAREEREAIQAEQDAPVQQPDDSDIPFDTQDVEKNSTKTTDGTQTTQTKQAEAQGSQQGAEPVNNNSPIALEADRFKAPTFKESVLKAVEFAKKMFGGKTVQNKSDGSEIIIPNSGIKHAGSGKVSEAALAAFGKLDEIISTATYVGSENDKSGRNTIKEIRFYDRDVVLDGKPAKLRVVVRVAQNGTRYYDHFEIRGQEKAPAGQSGKQDGPDLIQPFTGAKPSEEGVSESVAQNAEQSTSPDLNAMFDDLLAEETGSTPAAAPEAPKTEREAKEQRTAAEAAKSAAKNTAEGFNNAIDGLGKLFGGGPGTLGSGPVFNEETYKKAKPLFQTAVANFSQAGADIREVMRAVIKAVLDKFGKQATENMKPYIVRFVKDYQEGDKTEPTLDSAADLHTPEGKMKVAQTLADEFIGGASFKTIIEARKRISELIGKPIEAATELAKQADETIEVAVVLAGREIVQAGRKQGRSAQVIYDRLVDLYNRQPNLAVRSSTSVRDQAYSTPVPLAYLASELAGITADSKVLEPTAGNGMLLVGAATKNATANELNGKRADMLDAMGFESKRKNAATESLAPAKSQDAVIANPPFGATKDAAGNTIIYEVKPNYGTREVDHAIAFKALEAMKDDGRAVLIVGGSNATTDEGRQEDYRGKSKRSFYFNLYKDYNVVDHFTVDGSMYSKQGASYPVDVIVIEGRGKSKRDLPAADLPQVIRSYEELKGKLNGTRSVESEGVSGADGATGSESAGGQDNGTPVDRVPGRPGDGDGNQSGAGSDNASVSGTGSADNGRPDGSGAISGDGQSEPAYTPRLRNSGGRTVPGNGKAGTGSATSDRGNRSGNVDGTGRVDGQRVESGLTDRRGEETETDTQVSYAPRSNAASVGTLVPRAMRDAIEASLEKIEAQFGNIDEYVAERLNYDPETLRANFSAEQVDALALAIKNAEEGRGFIIGDQTGIGKGRVVAAMIRYAIINDKTPIFVTEKPNLYSDMIRDLDDIGMTDELGLDTNTPKIFMTNADETVPYSLIREKNGEITENNLTLRPPKKGKAMGELMRQMMAGESLGDFKVIFTTYSQLQTVKGKVTDRMNFVKQFGAGNYMIFDESHNAGGGGETQARTKDQREKAKEGESLVTGRAAFVRNLVNNAFGTFFSSATYAKRPDVMDLYSSTNMKLAVDKISQLGQAIKLGGVPMQQVVATMLTKDGQYIRRERTFAGVSYDTVETKVDKQTAENMAAAMRAVLDFSRAKEAVVKQIQKEMDKEGALVKQMGGEKATIQGANFGSIMHNLIDQMLLSLKVQESVNHAIARLKAGEKVVMTVSNTMGSFLKDYAEEMGLNMGDPVALSFKDLYDRYLEKQRMVTVKDSGGNKTQRRLTDAELGPNLVAKFEAVRKQIADSGFGSAPISPIDYMHNELRKAGFKTDEITGRTVTLNYQSGTPMLTRRSADIRQRVKAVRGFNGGEVDVLILNQAGSTGLSLHASSKFKDQRKRHMIVVQAEKNIDTHMQMLGRVHRTGQIIPPAYSQMMADIPAEMRPAAVLAKKMASLSANTTASRKSAVSAEGIVDFMNDYGGQVAQEFLRDNPDILESLGGNKVLPLNENSEDASEDDIRKFTGYIPILPIKQQEQIYKDLIERYNELIERENTLGTNKLEAKAVDLDAKVLSSQQITENKGDPSIFASPANMEQVDVKRNVKPYTSAEVTEMVNERVGDKTGGAIANEMAKDVAERTATFEKQRVDELQKKEVEPVKIESQRSQINLALNHVRAVLQNYRIGDSIQIKDKNSFIVYGVITDIQNKGRTQNPAAGSAWKMQIALANGDAKSLTINFGQIGSRYELSRETRVNWYNSETQSAELMSIMEVFDKGSTARRDKRWLVTGNILAGFAKYPGQIIQYTKADGTTGQGVLMSRQFDFNKEQKNAPVTLKSGDQVMQFFREVGDRAMVGTPDAVLKIGFYNGRFTFTVPSSKREGGTYFLDTGITGALGTDFYKRGQQMQASTYSAEDAKAAIDYIIRDREDSIIAMSSVDKAREMFAPKPAQGQGGVTLNDIPSNLSSDAIFTTVPETDRVSALTRLKSLERKAAAGKITDAEYRLGIAQLIAQLQKRANERNTPAGDRVRGPDWIKERLLRARRTGELDGEMVDFAMWLLEKNPNLANDLAISIREGNDNTPAGSYQSLGRLMSLFKNSTNHGTAVHEILHHAERMMPLEIQQGISREWQRAWDAAYRKGDEKTRAALVELLKSGLGNKVSLQSVVQAFRDGTLNYEDHYQLTSPSEYWAVNATRIMAKRYGATTWQEKARNFLRDLIEYMKGALKFRSDTPILKGLRNVMNGNGQFISQKMLVEQYMEQVPAPKTNTVQPTEFMDIRNAVQSKLFRDRTKLSTFNWYDKSISTQLNKALKDADYAKVFGYVNAIQNEISLTSLRAAELAPGYLPRITDVKAAAKTLVVGRKSGAQQAKASQAVFAGTLAGDNVMEGKVWTEQELRNNFGLDDAGVALYFQARAAIDASLDEVAAAEAYAMAQGFVPKAMRRAIIDNPGAAETIISQSLEQQITKLQKAAKVARAAGNDQQAASMEETLNGFFSTAKQVEKIFTTARNLKAAGYAPLMRFGKYTVTVQLIDPATGNLVRDDEGNPLPAVFFGKFETEGEAIAVMEAQQMRYAGQDDIKISAGTASQQGYEMYSGISPETLALFAEALGAEKVMRKYIEEALSERSALKRRLERMGVEGYTQDMPRVLANFITSNARHAAKQYYMRDLNNAIKYIPKEKGDVRDEAIALREFALNSKDPGSVTSSIAFFWFLGGSVSSAAVNMTQPIMMTLPYLSQYGPTKATAAMTKALPIALGKQEMDVELKAAMRRASQEGVVDAQEIFHLYSQGAQSTATWLASALSKVPGAGAKIKAGSDSARARMSAFGVLWGSMFAAAEGFNRRLTFAAAWELAKQRGERNPYAFAVRAVNETQGIFNKANRPNWARQGLGRMAFTFKQYSIMYLELVKRMVKHGGPEGRRAALMMLVILMLLSGEEGLPFMQDLGDLIDTIGQFLGYNTNTMREKRKLAYDIIGKEFGDFALYGVSSFMPLDFQGRLGLGNLIPGTSLLKKSESDMGKVRSALEIIGPTASIGQQFGDAAEALSDENYGQAARNMAPTAVKNFLLGLDMLDKGYAVDAAGNRKVNTTPVDAVFKMVGFNPTVVAEKNRSQMPIRQDIELHNKVESSIVKQWARGYAEKDNALIAKAKARQADWNASNPENKIQIKAKQVVDAVQKMKMDSDKRLVKKAPPEMRKGIKESIKRDQGIVPEEPAEE